MAEKNVGKVLAEGEVTGHAHRLTETDVTELDNGVRVFDAASGDVLTHEEHGTVHLPPGEYAADRVVEQDHFAEEARRVVD